MRILDEQREALVERERALLEDLVGFLEKFRAPPEDVDLARRALSDTKDLFLLVVVGEFNAGKSAVINALLGEEVAREGAIPTTERITVYRFGPEPAEQEERAGGGVLEKGYPNELLREVAVVDTPGTNAVVRQHEALSREFVPRSDLVLFVTSSDRPFTESEREYLTMIQDWGKKVVLVVNKADLLEFGEAGNVRAFVEGRVRDLLGFAPPVFMASARVARRAKAAGTSLERYSTMQASGFDRLEEHVRGLLGDEDRVRLKLESPLGVVEELIRRYWRAVDERARLLSADLKMSNDVQMQLKVHEGEMRRDFAAYLAQVGAIVGAVSERGEQWFEKNIRVKNSLELLRREKVRERFEKEVVADTARLVEEGVREVIDWMVDRNLRQWQAIVEHAEIRRQVRYDVELSGEIDDGFGYYRAQLLRSLGEAATRVVETHNHEKEAERLALSLRGAVAQMAAAEIGALGLGTAAGVLAPTVALDVSGLTAAVVAAWLGLTILPDKRRKASKEFKEKTNELRERLSKVVKERFEVELGRLVGRMKETSSSYTDFVRSEHARTAEAREALARLGAEVEALRGHIQATTAPA